MSQERSYTAFNPNEADCSDEQTGVISDGSEETVCDFEDVREYDLGEGD